jgi:hypothetical protein
LGWRDCAVDIPEKSSNAPTIDEAEKLQKNMGASRAKEMWLTNAQNNKHYDLLVLMVSELPHRIIQSKCGMAILFAFCALCEARLTATTAGRGR